MLNLNTPIPTGFTCYKQTGKTCWDNWRKVKPRTNQDNLFVNSAEIDCCHKCNFCFYYVRNFI